MLLLHSIKELSNPKYTNKPYTHNNHWHSWKQTDTLLALFQGQETMSCCLFHGHAGLSAFPCALKKKRKDEVSGCNQWFSWKHKEVSLHAQCLWSLTMAGPLTSPIILTNTTGMTTFSGASWFVLELHLVKRVVYYLHLQGWLVLQLRLTPTQAMCGWCDRMNPRRSALLKCF